MAEQESLTEQTERALRDMVVRGRFQPGDRIVEREVSEQLGVSRVPVREALRRLEHQGFVTTAPHRGAVVRTMSLTDVEDLFDLRIGLDRMAAEAAAHRHASGEVHEGLAHATARAEEATAAGGEATITANAHFHDQLLAASGNPLLVHVAAPVQARTRWLFAMTADRDPELQCREHRQLYDAIRSGNADLAGWYAAAHVEAGRAASLAQLREQGRVTAEPATADNTPGPRTEPTDEEPA